MTDAEIDAREILAGTLKARGTRKIPSADEIEVYKLSESGIPLTEISATRSLSEARVKACIAKVEKFAASGLAVDVAAIKAQQHLRLEAVREAAMTAFQNTNGIVRTTKRKLDSDGKVIEETVTEQQAFGDPRYLNSAMKALEAQRDLWPGLAAPRATALTNSDGSGDPKLTVEILNQMSDEELESLGQVVNMLDAKLIESRPGDAE